MLEVDNKFIVVGVEVVLRVLNAVVEIALINVAVVEVAVVEVAVIDVAVVEVAVVEVAVVGVAVVEVESVAWVLKVVIEVALWELVEDEIVL